LIVGQTTLVTGGTGSVGRAVVRALLEAGWHVRVFARHAPPDGLLPPAARVFIGDITDPTALTPAVEGCVVVHHLAGLGHAFAAESEFTRVNVLGAKTVAAVAQHAAVSRVVLYSSIAVYGPTDGREPATETDPLHPITPYAHSKATAEQVVAALAPTTIVRLAAVYGPNMKGNYVRLLRALAAGKYVAIGGGQNRRTLVFETDVARAAMMLASDSRAESQIFNVTDGRTHHLREIVAAIASALGRTAPRLHLPVKPVQVAADVLDVIGRLGVYAPVFGRSLRTYLEDVAVSGEKIQITLGFQPLFDLASGWRHVVDETTNL